MDDKQRGWNCILGFNSTFRLPLSWPQLTGLPGIKTDVGPALAHLTPYLRSFITKRKCLHSDRRLDKGFSLIHAATYTSSVASPATHLEKQRELVASPITSWLRFVIQTPGKWRVVLIADHRSLGSSSSSGGDDTCLAVMLVEYGKRA